MEKLHFLCSVRQPGFTYSACRPFSKNKERIKKKIENNLDKACF